MPGIDFGGTELGLFYGWSVLLRNHRGNMLPYPLGILTCYNKFLSGDRFEPLGSKDFTIVQKKLLVLLSGSMVLSRNSVLKILQKTPTS